jgi:predicted amidohydrolase
LYVRQLLAVYHKTHLYFEAQFDAGSGEPVYFDTDFGARIGIFICFDIWFEHPMMDLIAVRLRCSAPEYVHLRADRLCRRV